jgi:hypothetical protein
MGGAALLALSAAIIPPMIWGPNLKVKAPATVSADRPTSTATINIVHPADGETVTGTTLDIVMTLPGGKIVDYTGTNLTPDTGHIHILLDHKLISMTFGLVQEVSLQDLAPGTHLLEAEFVAVDHAPFDPPVTSSVTFKTTK